jgi:hypothetical protein
MINPLTVMTVLIVMLTACSSSPPKRDTAQQPSVDPPLGTILRQFAIQRSLQECKVNTLSVEQCKKSVDDAQQHLDSINARIEVLLKNPKTNMCDLARWAGSVATPFTPSAIWPIVCKSPRIAARR